MILLFTCLVFYILEKICIVSFFVGGYFATAEVVVEVGAEGGKGNGPEWSVEDVEVIVFGIFRKAHVPVLDKVINWITE